MIHTIENDQLICKITSEGAEIRSLKDKFTGKEFIWQIDDTIWGSSSPVLFPAIGKIKSGKIEYKGKSYEMPKHGIIRHNKDLKFKKHTENHCEFLLENSTKTIEQYPFKFSFKVDYELKENSLIMTYQIQNNDKVDIYFACGGHTAYACPLEEQTKLSDYVLEFPYPVDLKAKTLGESGLLSNRTRDIKTHHNLLQLSKTLFNEDALIFADIDFDWIRLRRKNEEKGVLVNFKNYPNLALWSKPGADYVCIEPWLGLPDHENENIDLKHKTNLIKLSSLDSYSISIETLVE